MILIVTMANHRYTHKSLEEEADLDLRVLSYSELFNHQGDRPTATYVFTDFDRLAGFALDRAALLYRELRDQGSVVLNDPGSRARAVRLASRAQSRGDQRLRRLPCRCPREPRRGGRSSSASMAIMASPCRS